MQLGVDRRRQNPALIGEGEGADAGEQPAVRPRGDGLVREDGNAVAVHETHDRSADTHHDERDELDNGHGDLKLSGETRREGVDADAHHEVKRADADRHGAEIVVAEEHGRIARGDEGERRGDDRVIHCGHKPAHVIAELRSERRLGVIHDAVAADVFRAHRRENAGADDADKSDDADDEQALSHAAARVVQNVDRLEEHAGADDDADDHGNCRHEPEFLFQLVFHTLFLFPSPKKFCLSNLQFNTAFR